VSALETASEFLAKSKDMASDAVSEAYKALPKEVQSLYRKLHKDEFFDPKNAVTEKRREVMSPSGKYKLVITPFATGPHSWNYAQGIVYRKDNDKPIEEVRRNYGAFPNTFVEGHANGHDYLICGEDYQGQTIIELDTGKRRDSLSDGTDKGFGFCWSSHRFEAAHQILVVCGCHWACPYEHRLYDFSDPMMNGWPEIEPEDERIDADEGKEPEILPDGTIKTFMTRYTDDDEYDDTPDDEKKVEKAPIVDVVKTYRREGLKLVLVEEWVSDYEKDRRKRNAEYEKQYQEWLANFKATDPLYLAYSELVKDSALSPADYMSMGQTYEGWCPDFKGHERRFCRRIVSHKGKTGPTIDLEWAVETGPIKLVLFKDGKTNGDKFFEHSVEGMNQAFAFAKEYAHAQ
jgi:hypothetical protein